MAELTEADLQPMPNRYQSSRQWLDVLVGDDDILPLMAACSSGDVTTLRSLLTQSPYREAVLGSRHCIYHEEEPSSGPSDVRGVLAMKMTQLERLTIRAATSGHAAAVSTLLDFGTQNGIPPSTIISLITVKRAILNGHAAVIETLATAEPTIVNYDVGHEQPLDLAIKKRKHEVAAVLLRHGALGRDDRPPDVVGGSYASSPLSLSILRSAGIRTTEILLEQGSPVAGSGALHSAAERGVLDTMELLIQHGADVNERLRAESLPHVRRNLLASWTPMHFAASTGQVDAVKLLESNGAQADALDGNAQTPWYLLSEQSKE